MDATDTGYKVAENDIQVPVTACGYLLEMSNNPDVREACTQVLHLIKA